MRTVAPRPVDKPLSTVRDEAEKLHILSALQRTGWRRAPAARLLGISRKTLWKKLRRLSIEAPTDVSKG
jgi:transcriptional regulator of acetoin/glycerol metabolism